MKRRTSIKILGLGFIGTSFYSMIKWMNKEETNFQTLLITRKSLIADLADTIIPTTDTPGAKDAGVESFIIMAMLDCEGKKNQQNFARGLDEVEELSIRKYHTSFEKCSAQNKIEILKYFQRKEPSGMWLKMRRKVLGDSFFYLLTYYTSFGFCTSYLGSTVALSYDPIPEVYQSCIYVSENQKSWATK